MFYVVHNSLTIYVDNKNTHTHNVCV